MRLPQGEVARLLIVNAVTLGYLAVAALLRAPAALVLVGMVALWFVLLLALGDGHDLEDEPAERQTRIVEWRNDR